MRNSILLGMDPVLKTVKELIEAAEPGTTVREVGRMPPGFDKPFMLRPRSDEEIAQYDLGFLAGKSDKVADDTKTEAWQRGWLEAQE
jgi:hypothetical protein